MVNSFHVICLCFIQFPPYATNEIGRPGAALARREIGHGKYIYWGVLINISKWVHLY